ncbi:MAG: hypothetical protein MJ234_01410 [bacterium]|nr:hypothetical protein [bacterium]
MLNRRPSRVKDIKDLQKEYKANPVKFFILFTCFIVIFLIAAINSFSISSAVPECDGSQLILYFTAGISGLAVIISGTIGIGDNFGKRILLTPVFCEFKHGKKRFRTFWKELSMWNESDGPYKSLFFEESGFRVYVDSVFFDKFEEIDRIANTAKKRALSKDSINI